LRPPLRCRSGDPATDPHSGTRDSLPSLWPPRGQRLRRERLRRKRLRRAPSALTAPPYQCPARFIGSSAECTFPSPPLRFCTLCSARCLSLFSARPGPATAWPARGARRGPRRTSDTSQQVTCHLNFLNSYHIHCQIHIGINTRGSVV